jgi:hypothetical protein
MKKMLLVCGLLSALSLNANAAIIETSGNNLFEDLGGTTVDLQTGIEWLDVTSTVGRSFMDVQNDIQTDGGSFDAGVWRYATSNDMETLGMNWFGLDISQTIFTFLSESQQLLLESFIGTFGDTLVAYIDSINYTDIVFDSEGGGFTHGFIDANDLYPDSPSETRSTTMFLHDEYTNVSDGSRYNGPDLLAAQSEVYSADSEFADLGSFLIRDYGVLPSVESPVEVSEPSSLGVLVSSIFGMMLLRRRKVKLKF